MHLTVTTPRGYLVQVEAEELVAPGVLGEFGILPGHIPFMSVLKPGVLSYRGKDGTKYLAVGDGILQVARVREGDSESDKVEVLVNRGENGRDVDREAAQRELSAADSELAKSKAENMAELKPMQDRRAWAAAQVDAATRTSPH
jgi:ATP synthase, F1 epsilon subunit (delta in mitochondria)